MPPGRRGRVRGGLPPARAAAVFNLACRMTGSGRRRGPAAGDLPPRPPETRRLRARPRSARIYRLAANCCVDFLRSRQHRDRQATRNSTEAVTPARSAAGLRVEQLDLERAIERLPRDIGRHSLHDVEGFEHAEVARLLGIAEGTRSPRCTGAAESARCWPRGRRWVCNSIMTCDLARDRISELVDGDLDRAARAELDAHLATCASCAALAEDLEVRRASRSLPTLDPPGASGPRSRASFRSRPSTDRQAARASSSK